MQVSKILQLKNIFLSGIILLSFSLIVSCKQKIKLASVKYDSTVVSKWLADSSVSEFILQFSTPKLNTGNPFQLISYVLDSSGNCLNDSIPDLLGIRSETSFDEKAILGNNVIVREKFEEMIKDSSGHKIAFDYILLIPKIDEKYQHVVYEINVVKNEQILDFVTNKPISNPCPPDCPAH